MPGAFGKIAIALVLIFGAFMAYGTYADRVAARRAAAMCASIAPGDDAAALYPRAMGGASRVLRLDDKGTERMLILYVGMPPFSRFSCEVQSTSGRVVATRTSHID